MKKMKISFIFNLFIVLIFVFYSDCKYLKYGLFCDFIIRVINIDFVN